MRRMAVGRFTDPESPRGYIIDYSAWAEQWDERELPETPGGLARLALGDLELYLARGTPERRDRFELAVRPFELRHMKGFTQRGSRTARVKGRE